jgi:hypothetical protein
LTSNINCRQPGEGGWGSKTSAETQVQESRRLTLIDRRFSVAFQVFDYFLLRGNTICTGWSGMQAITGQYGRKVDGDAGGYLIYTAFT